MADESKDKPDAVALPAWLKPGVWVQNRHALYMGHAFVMFVDQADYKGGFRYHLARPWKAHVRDEGWHTGGTVTPVGVDSWELITPLPESRTLSGETPRTDAAAFKQNDGTTRYSTTSGAPLKVVTADFSRQLERELAEVSARAVMWAESKGKILTMYENTKAELDAIRSASGIRYITEPGIRGPLDVAPVSTSGRSDETAWLIEMPAARWGTGYFWIGPRKWSEWGQIEDAIRFSRKADADAVIALLDHRIKYESCEHMWPVVPSARPLCPYCTSDNEEIRGTYYDQNCKGCVARMALPGHRPTDTTAGRG